MAERRTLKQLIARHEEKAIYAERKAEEWLARAAVSRNRARALREQAQEAAS